MKKISYVGALMLAAAALFASATTAQADVSCPGGTACFWTGDSFQGLKLVRGNESEGFWLALTVEVVNFRSLKNHFDRRAIWTRHGLGSATCTNPGIHRNNAPIFDQFYVGAVGSRC